MSAGPRSSICWKVERKHLSSEENAMDHKGSADILYDQLRRLVASDPKRARVKITEVLASGPEPLTAVLDLASRPGEGRVRQMIAIAARLGGRASAIQSRLL